MPLITFHTRKVRDALKAPERLGPEVVVLLLVAGVFCALLLAGRQAVAPYREKVVIDLSLSALPAYTLLSLCRGFAAYVLSLAFTLAYGTLAAHNRAAEKVMLPALDVLQAIPVLGFLPGLVIAMIRLFPTREIGLEIACVVMIFTAQAWNMTFSFHGSLRGIPQPLREVARLQGMGGWQVFRLLEVPSAMIGLVWNSMMSMAGGWFFLTVNEAFTLGDKDYRLPGIGSYMNEAIRDGNSRAMIAAIVAMVIMIVAVDQLFWRPVVVWAQRFKLEEQATSDKPESWVLDMLLKSRLFTWIKTWGAARRLHRHMRRRGPKHPPTARSVATENALLTGLKWVGLTAVFIGAMWGAWALVRLLTGLPVHNASGEDWVHVFMALGASFLRTTAAVVIGAAWALPVGIVIGRSPRWSQRLQPVIQVVASFPAPMLFPLVTMGLLVLHVPFTFGCVALMLLGAQWYILFNVIAGAMAIPSELREVSTLYGVSRVKRWTKLYIPSVFPYLLTGLVTAAGGAWNATIVSEYVQLKDQTYAAFGLGSMISKATEAEKFSLLAAAVVTMAVFVVILNRLFWKRLYRLAEERYSLNV